MPIAPDESNIPQPVTLETSDEPYRPGRIDIFMLGVSTVLGGQYFGWNIGLTAGVYSFIIAAVFVTMAYIAFVWSMSEASGALPFAGGAYGLARCTLGFYPAFLVGCFQIVQYIFSVAIAIVLLMPMIVSISPGLQDYTAVIMAVLYLVTLLVQIRGGRMFWGIVWIFGVFGIGAILVYAIGNISSINFFKYGIPIPSVKFINGARGFFDGMPYTSYFFVGIEALNLASCDVAQPKTTIPRAQMTCMAVMLVTSMFAFFIAMSLPSPTGVVSIIGTLAPLSNGFSRIFKVSKAGATWITIVPTYGVAYGFMWAYARLIKSMASSKLLPPVLGTTNRFGVPWVAHLVGSVVGFGVCLTMNYIPVVIYYVFPITMAFSFLAYMGQCLAYIMLHRDFPVMKQSTMKSPFGIPGAVYSLCVWITCLVSTLLNGRVVLVVVPFTVVATIYYYAIARKRQTFSDEENKILLTAHVSRFNTQKRKHTKSHGNAGGPKVHPSHGPSHGLSHGRSPGPSHAPSHGPSRGPSQRHAIAGMAMRSEREHVGATAAVVKPEETVVHPIAQEKSVGDSVTERNG